MPELIFTDSYEKRARKFFKSHPELKSQYAKVLQLLAVNPGHPSLRLHKLKGKLSELHSVSISHSCRITLQFLIKKDWMILIDIGKHERVY